MIDDGNGGFTQFVAYTEDDAAGAALIASQIEAAKRKDEFRHRIKKIGKILLLAGAILAIVLLVLVS